MVSHLPWRRWLRAAPVAVVVASFLLLACGGDENVPVASRPCAPLTEPSSSSITYAATTPDGQRLVVFARSEHPYTLRVFYGPDARLLERKVLEDNRDSSLHLAFDLDGTRAFAQLNFPATGGYMFGPTRLEHGGRTVPLTAVPGSPGDPEANPPHQTSDAGPPPPEPTPRATNEELVAGLSFVCF